MFNTRSSKRDVPVCPDTKSMASSAWNTAQQFKSAITRINAETKKVSAIHLFYRENGGDFSLYHVPLALGEVLGEYRMKMKRRVGQLNCCAWRFCCIKTMIRLIF